MENETKEIIEIVKSIGSFLNKLVGDAVVEVGGTLHDWAKLFRYRNLLRIQDKVEEIHRTRKLQGKSIPIPPRFAIPLIQAASQEDEPSIQDMWAALIANATDPERALEVKKVFTDILSSLEPLDARVLERLANQGWAMFRDGPHGGVTVPRLASTLKTSEKEIRFALQNLYRLGCIFSEYDPTYEQITAGSTGLRVSDPKTTFRPSPLGFDLLEACDRTGSIENRSETQT
jgi:hypothetical protein